MLANKKETRDASNRSRPPFCKGGIGVRQEPVNIKGYATLRSLDPAPIKERIPSRNHSEWSAVVTASFVPLEATKDGQRAAPVRDGLNTIRRVSMLVGQDLPLPE